MARKAFLLRIDEKTLAAVQKWADDELRSLNGQIEYLLREALRRRGVKPPTGDDGNDENGDEPDSTDRPRPA